jgi:hypothetical protein
MSAPVLAFQTSVQGCGSTCELQQVGGLFDEHRLMELVRGFTDRSCEPRGRLAEFFARITHPSRTSLTMDKPFAVEFRKHAETFFLMETKNV